MATVGEAGEPEPLNLGTAIAFTVITGAMGWGIERAAAHLGWVVPTFGFLTASLLWAVVTFGALLWLARHHDGHRLDDEALGRRQPTTELARPYPWRLALVVGTLAVVALVVVGQSTTSFSSSGEVRHASLDLTLAWLLVRYPLTVYAEEATFRGWMQPRLGENGPVLSAVLWAGWHLTQASTIPTLVLFGLGLGFLRWRLRSIRVPFAVHYVSDALFFVLTYS